MIRTERVNANKKGYSGVIRTERVNAKKWRATDDQD